MASGLTLQVRQISSYPEVGAAGPGDLLLMQPGGLGNPYASVDAQTLVQTALSASSLGVGNGVPAGAASQQIFSGNLITAPDGGILFNSYINTQGQILSWLGGNLSGDFSIIDPVTGFAWRLFASTGPGQPVTPFTLMTLNPAGALSLNAGTLTVARDPGAAMEVATMGWVGRNTATSFNGRQGAITLNGCDVLSALCLPSVASQEWVCATIQASTEMLLANHPFVFGWNGRTGAVYLTLADISCVFFQPGQQPITPTAPPTSNDYSIANTQWVTTYVTETLAGDQGLATEAWVLANTVNSFNGRAGAVTLNLADVTVAGGAPLNSPQFTGIPQAPTATPGQASGQLATTLFVQQAVQSAVTGVVSWNGRTGAVELEATDINDAGGALLASPALTGTPTAPTASTGTATTQLATCAFVLNEVQAIGAGVTSFNGRSGNVTLSLGDITGAGGAPIASPAFSGTPTCPSPLNPLQGNAEIANTQWVVQYVSLQAVSSFNGRTGAVSLSAADISGAGGLANPNVALTGAPTAPTAVPGTSTTQIATTNFVMAAISNLGGNYVPLAGNVSISGPLTMLGAGSTFTLAANAASNLQAVPLQQLTSTLASYATIAQLNSAPYIPQNYADNSGFTINQRQYVSGTALAAGAFGLDRWKAGSGGATITFTQAPASTLVTITAGSLLQVVEGAALVSGSYTLSWTGTATGRAYTTTPGAYAASPVQLTAAAGVNLSIEFTGGTVGQVQLQPGTVATPWQPNPVQVEFARCQRFFQNWSVFMCGYGGGSATVLAQSWALPVTMRASPTGVVLQNNSAGNISGGSLGNLTQGYVTAQATSTAAGAFQMSMAGTASADL